MIKDGCDVLYHYTLNRFYNDEYEYFYVLPIPTNFCVSHSCCENNIRKKILTRHISHGFSTKKPKSNFPLLLDLEKVKYCCVSFQFFKDFPLLIWIHFLRYFLLNRTCKIGWQETNWIKLVKFATKHYQTIHSAITKKYEIILCSFSPKCVTWNVVLTDFKLLT